MRASILIGSVLVLMLGLTAAVLAASPGPSAPSPGTSTVSPSPGPSAMVAAEATCPPPPDHLLVAPVGAAWIGGFEGVFGPADGARFASWSIDETLVGGPLGTDGLLWYPQPACDPVLTGGVGEPYLITTADPTSPTTDDTVVWRIGPDDRVSLVWPDLDTPASVYAVETLDDARALVLSGDLPAGLAPSPSMPIACPLDGMPVASPVPGDQDAARHALRTHYDALAGGAMLQGAHVGTPTNDRDALCLWMTIAPTDFGGADLSRAWLIEVTRGPTEEPTAMEIWIAAPMPDGTWGLWWVR